MGWSNGVASGVFAHDTRYVALSRMTIVFALGAGGCGPSYQAIYECDVRFEHCYAIDESAVSTEAKKQCWRDWLRGYTYGQSGDRIEFAAARVSELSLDPTLPSVESREVRPGKRSAALVPTNAFAPPPKLAEHSVASAPPAATVEEVVVRAPGSECTDACAQSWRACHDSCKGNPCEDNCSKAYRACVPACFASAGSSR
jgi:hypothetical protein